MSATRHTFIDLFKGNGIRKIVIPKIQRDYAQGRSDAGVSRVRERFLTALRDAIVQKPITLDFVYGDVDAKGTLTPLDGQQRLTTLFLLHWYAAKKEAVPEEDGAFLKCFSYATRYSARDFCEKLVAFTPLFTKPVSDDIEDQGWFPLEWKKDPTIASMLVMLDAIQERFKDVPHVWERLKEGAITFYFLPIKELDLSDELYIKMNSRGKPLTEFEHFKAELERELRLFDEKVAGRISEKIDGEWTDLLWGYRNSSGGAADVIDDAFLNYFRFVCDIIYYKSQKSTNASRDFGDDVFDLLRRHFSSEGTNTAENIETLESFFDCWCKIEGYERPTAFLESFMSTWHEKGKITIWNKAAPDILKDCLGNYRQFPLGRMVLLYAIVVYLRNQDKVTKSEFVRRIRIVNNLIQNSDDEIAERKTDNRIPAILKQVDSIILKGGVDDTIKNTFNATQLQEEREKIKFLADHPEKAELLFKLEDHGLLKGQIRIIGLEGLDCYAPRFASLFSCDWNRIDRALMAVGDYGQMERNGKRYQYGSSESQQAWIELFHASANDGFEKTARVLLQLLGKRETFTDDDLDKIASSFVTECEQHCAFPWRYYYVKYPAFRPGLSGKFYNEKKDEEGKPLPYTFSVIPRRNFAQESYMPFLKEADERHLSREYKGQRLGYKDVYITCENSAYSIRRNDDDEEIDRLEIAQNQAGDDTEDRIVKLKEYIQDKK